MYWIFFNILVFVSATNRMFLESTHKPHGRCNPQFNVAEEMTILEQDVDAVVVMVSYQNVTSAVCSYSNWVKWFLANRGRTSVSKTEITGPTDDHYYLGFIDSHAYIQVSVLAKGFKNALWKERPTLVIPLNTLSNCEGSNPITLSGSLHVHLQPHWYSYQWGQCKQDFHPLSLLCPMDGSLIWFELIPLILHGGGRVSCNCQHDHKSRSNCHSDRKHREMSYYL